MSSIVHWEALRTAIAACAGNTTGHPLQPRFRFRNTAFAGYRARLRYGITLLRQHGCGASAVSVGPLLRRLWVNRCLCPSEICSANSTMRKHGTYSWAPRLPGMSSQTTLPSKTTIWVKEPSRSRHAQSTFNRITLPMAVAYVVMSNFL